MITAPPAVTAPVQEGFGLSDMGYVTLGIGGALLASAATVDWLSGDLREEFINESQGGPATSSERYDDLRDRVQTRQTVFWGLGASGAALAVAGVGMLVWDLAASPERGRGDDHSVTVKCLDSLLFLNFLGSALEPLHPGDKVGVKPRALSGDRVELRAARALGAVEWGQIF